MIFEHRKRKLRKKNVKMCNSKMCNSKRQNRRYKNADIMGKSRPENRMQREIGDINSIKLLTP